MFEVKPILSALIRHKSSTLLIVLQIAITFAVVVNSTSIIQKRIEMMNRDSGLPEEHLVALNINAFGENYDIENNIRADVDLLRSLPEVVDAVALNQVPLTGNGDSFSIASSQEKFDNFESHEAGSFHGDSHLINTLGVKLIAGEDFTEEEVAYTSGRPDLNSAIITQSLANKLYPGENALGKQVFLGGGMKVTVKGIVEKMSGSWVHSSIFEDSLFTPFVRLSAFSRILIRVESKEAATRLLGEVENLLIKRNPERVIFSVRSVKEHSDRSYAGDASMMSILWLVIGLLVVITALGIFGIVSFNVNQRTKQIGTRRALGATKVDILRYFLTENLLITSLGLLVGILMTFGFNIFLAEQFEMPAFNWTLIPVGCLLMFLVGIIAVWLPAQKASKVSPAIATQSI